MAKYHGKIGFIITHEDPVGSGIWKEEAIEKDYRGDVLARSFYWSNREAVTDDLTLSQRISIVADGFAMTNLGYMRYVEYMGVMWKITTAEIERPRIVLTLGGVYNGQQA